MDAYRYFNEIYGYKQSGWKIALKQGATHLFIIVYIIFLKRK